MGRLRRSSEATQVNSGATVPRARESSAGLREVIKKR